MSTPQLVIFEKVVGAVKEAHKELTQNKMPHIIAFLVGGEVHVIIAGEGDQRKQVLDAIMADKGWRREDVEKCNQKT